MKPKLTFSKYIIALLLTVTACATILATNISKMNTDMSEQNSVLKRQLDALEAKTENIAQYKTQIDTLSAEISSLRHDVERKADKPGRGGERPCYELSAEERDLIERVVMAEAEDEPYIGQMLVCQCILNACRLNNKRPKAIIKQYAYATRRPEPSESIRKAVEAVFDKGETVTDEPIIYFYAPALVKSAFHERQRFVTEVGGHRFFCEG
jgi:spore germination cell wall hydrolase CwlJ-like protein